MPIAFEKFMLDKNTPLPLYYQIETFLLNEIKSGNIITDECIPPEIKLVELFGVSRATVRQAISNLVNQGVLSRQKGKGTFVTAPKVQEHALQVLESFHEEMQKKGYKPTTKVLSFKRVSAIPEINEKLGVGKNEELFELMRTRSVNNEAVLTFRTYLPSSYFPELMKIDFERNSLYEHLEVEYGCRVDRVVRHIEAAVASKEEAELLGIERKAAVFHVTFIGYANDRAVEYSRTTYRGDRIEFVVEVRR